ncbi:MAG: IPT/TIG domain-containing protein [Planctomycetota bacterium]|nr:IPT/TIG domain-containing protein [Planctomycetota bacterium]
MKAARVRLVLTGAMALAVGLTLVACGGSSSNKGRGGPSATIISVTPVSGTDAGGTIVTIVTQNFSDDFTVNPPAVQFGGVDATGEAGTAPDTVVATTPPHTAGAVDVVVTASVNVQTATDAGGYTYTSGPVNCTIVSVNPMSGAPIGGDPVSISGTDFEAGATVTFGGVAATNISTIGTTLIMCDTPPHAAGMVDVRVQSANRDCILSNGYEYIAAPTNCLIGIVNASSGSTLGGEFVTLTGNNFETGSTVTFGGVAAANVDTVDPSLITCDTPAHAPGMVDVRVQSVNRDCTLLNGYEFIDPPANCMMTSINPPNGPQGGGTQVTILGVDFGPVPPDPTVTFAGLGAAIVSATDTQIVCTTPGQPSTGPVTVRITNSTAGFCEWVGGFTYDPVGGPSCRITNISPNMGDAAGGDLVTIAGNNFDPAGTEVFFGTELGLSPTVTSTMIIVTTPPGAQIGPVDVLVVPQGFDTCTDAGGYTYTGCVVLDVLPNVGVVTGGTPVAVSGIGFNPIDSEVTIDGNPSMIISRAGTQILCWTPAGAAPGLVDVTVSSVLDGTSCTLPGGFQYSGCVINTIMPSSGPKVGGTFVRIDGSDFDILPTDIRFGNFFASNVTVLSSTQITCDAPPSLIDGPVDLVISQNTGKTCTIVAGYSYDIPPAPGNCTITSIVPPNGPVTGGTDIMINGTGFDAGTPGVIVNLRPATNVVRVSDTEITCTTPRGNIEGVVSIHVVNPSGGDCTAAGGFTYDPPPGCPSPSPCVLTSISPNSDLASGGIIAFIDGANFCPGMHTVTFTQTNSVNAVILLSTDLLIQIEVPPAPDGPGPATVLVATPFGICGPIPFTYN